MYKLIALDIDGTLLNSEKKISKYPWILHLNNVLSY